MHEYLNPFPTGTDHFQIWQMLVERDIEAFIQSDWAMAAQDFLESGFAAIDARGFDNPDSWRLTFPALSAYRDAWLEQSRALLGQASAEALRAALLAATTLRDIDIRDDAAIAHKKFDGQIVTNSDRVIPLRWQTLYQCRKVDGVWKIAGFVGYLPHPMGSYTAPAPTKVAPQDSRQHVTAGPYSPVLEVNPHRLVVISGQAAIDMQGQVIGETIEAQAQYTLDNCAGQLAAAGCSLRDVFKVNVYLVNLDDWGRFNTVYRAVMPQPFPVRTAIQAQLLPGLLVEIEMWAAKS
jgi:enamine deaminase RidA (YjgF/YER057c/UK114 family)